MMPAAGFLAKLGSSAYLASASSYQSMSPSEKRNSPTGLRAPPPQRSSS